MNNSHEHTVFDELMQELESSLVQGSLQVGLAARQKEISIDLMAVAHLQTTIAASVLLLAERLMQLPCEMRNEITECLGLSHEDLRKIMETGKEITPDAAMKNAVISLSTVASSLKHTARSMT